MFDQRFFDYTLLKICSAAIGTFSVIGISRFNAYFVGFAFLLLSIYFGLVAWGKIKKSNSLFFTCIAFVSATILIENGFILAAVVATLIVFVAMCFLHWLVVKD
ncbi:MAG: hypothetical protein ACFHVJ_00465 [Aestuariibacter sp.]